MKTIAIVVKYVGPEGPSFQVEQEAPGVDVLVTLRRHPRRRCPRRSGGLQDPVAFFASGVGERQHQNHGRLRLGGVEVGVRLFSVGQGGEDARAVRPLAGVGYGVAMVRPGGPR